MDQFEKRGPGGDRLSRTKAKTTVEACRYIDMDSWFRNEQTLPKAVRSGNREWRLADTGEVTKLAFSIDTMNRVVRLH